MKLPPQEISDLTHTKSLLAHNNRVQKIQNETSQASQSSKDTKSKHLNMKVLKLLKQKDHI